MARTTQGGKQIRDRTITKADLDATGETEEDILVVQSDGSVDFQNINSLADIKKLQDNILLNAFRIAINGGLVKYNMVDGIMDEFEDESGVDTATSTNEDYDSVNDLYEPTSSGGLPSAEYSSDEYTVLLLHCNGVDASTTFTDSSAGGAGSPHTVTAVADAQIDTAQKVFGTGSALFDGTGDYLSIPDSDDWNFGNGNFTIDCWVRFADVTTSSMGICGQYVDSNNYWKIFYYKDITKLYFECKSASSYIPSYGVTWSPSVDTWYHIACVSDGTNVHFYVDGVEVGSGTAIGTIPELASVLEIGYASNEVRSIHFYMNGWIDEFRISKGIARWPSDFDVSVSDNMTLVSNSTEAEANPDNVRLVAFSEDVDAITLDTDLKFYASRDNGANWVQGTLSDEGDYNSGKRILTGEADVSGQASDKTMKWKIETLNNKDCKIRGLGLLWD